MERREPGTPEQKFCGTWFRCTDPRCQYTVLIPSEGLKAQLEGQRKGIHPAAKPMPNGFDLGLFAPSLDGEAGESLGQFLEASGH